MKNEREETLGDSIAIGLLTVALLLVVVGFGAVTNMFLFNTLGLAEWLGLDRLAFLPAAGLTLLLAAVSLGGKVGKE
jgi:hypothetical protein